MVTPLYLPIYLFVTEIICPPCLPCTGLHHYTLLAAQDDPIWAVDAIVFASRVIAREEFPRFLTLGDIFATHTYSKQRLEIRKQRLDFVV